MPNPILSLRNISKKYTEKVLYKDLCLDIYPGDFISICGESGTGKSTLFNIIAGFESPDSGDILYQGKKLDYTNSFRNKKLGFIFQSYNLLSKRTVHDNIKLPMLYGGNYNDAGEIVYKKLLNDLKITDIEHSISDNLSGGEKQRVAIARAMIMSPEILLADEPTGNLDVENANNILNMLKTINQNYNTAIILITHDITLAQKTHKIYCLDINGLHIC